MRNEEQSAVEILSDLVAIDSRSGREKEICRFIGKFLSGCGFAVKYQKAEGARENLFARKGNPKLLFFGHMDTVEPVGSWTRDPFRLTIEDGRAYGLGAWDMKGGISAILHAAQSAKDMAVLLTVDEEDISRGAWKALEEKAFFKGIRGIISAEAGNEPGSYGGARHISYGRYGRKAYRLTKELPAGHGATSEQSWVEWAYKSMSRLPEIKSRIVIRRFCATSKGLSVPDKAEIDVDVLIHPEEAGLDFQAVLCGHFGAVVELAKRETPYLEPYSFEGNGFIQEVAGIVRGSFGEPSFHLGTSVGDENALARLGIPIAIVGPEGRDEHKADEWVSMKSLDEVASLYRILLERLG